MYPVLFVFFLFGPFLSLGLFFLLFVFVLFFKKNNKFSSIVQTIVNKSYPHNLLNAWRSFEWRHVLCSVSFSNTHTHTHTHTQWWAVMYNTAEKTTTTDTLSAKTIHTEPKSDSNLIINLLKPTYSVIWTFNYQSTENV